MAKIAVLGYGTVGSGLVEVLERNSAVARKQAGEEVLVKYILDLRDFPGDPYEDRVIHDYNIILNDPEVSVVCEAMGGVGAAYQFTKQALEAGKSVCTSNKELVAKHGAKLLGIAAQKSCNYMFEASVGGGIPIIRAINTSLVTERIEEITGILNGTTNYILTRMEREGADYGQVLKQAQELGYAERNPEADVEGWDTCRKIAILASLVTGKNVDSEKIHTEGITGISGADFAYAEAADMTVKLLASCRFNEDGSVRAMVAPFMISRDHYFAGVNDVFNGILVAGDMVGEVSFGGRGAGKLPTASAVAADVVNCVRSRGRNISCTWKPEEVRLEDPGESERRFFIRASASERGAVEKAFGEGNGFVKLPEGGGEFGFFTPVMKEKDFDEKCSALGAAVLSRIRLA